MRGLSATQLVPAEAERLQRAGLEVGEHDVGARDELAEEPLALVVAQVQAEAALVAVALGEARSVISEPSQDCRLPSGNAVLSILMTSAP